MKPTEKQIGGSHYKDCPIQPIEYITANKLGFCEGNIVKYVTRHKSKNGRKDVEKALHYCELLLELEYGAAHEPTGTATKKEYLEWELFLREKDGISTKDREEILRKMFKT